MDPLQVRFKLRVRFKRSADGTVALTCTRDDGTTTWQRHEGRRAGFFELHDLTHFAVETVLGCREAFYGLIASGWNITDFVARIDQLTGEALRVETLVGLLDTERADGVPRTADELNSQAALHYKSRGSSDAPPVVAEEQLAAIRRLRDELFSRWASVPAGESLELTFNVSAD